MQLIKEIGANGVRLAHYPHSDYFYSLCDKEGLLVWAEIPFIGNGTESTAFEENLKQQLTELIRQNSITLRYSAGVFSTNWQKGIRKNWLQS